MREPVRGQVMIADVSRGDGQAPRKARIVVVPGRLRVQFTPRLGTPPEAPVDVPLADVTSVLCTSHGWWDVTGGHLTITGRTQDGVAVAFPSPVNPYALRRLLQALFAELPDDALVDVDAWYLRPARTTSPGSLVPAIVALVVGMSAVAAGYVVVGWDRMVAAAPQDRTPAPPPVSAPGYYRLRGVDGQVPALGAPWGERCAILQFVVPNRVPHNVLKAITDTLEQAQSALPLVLNVPATKVQIAYSMPVIPTSPDELERALLKTPKHVTVFQADAAPGQPKGTPQDDVALWRTTGSGSRTRFDWIQGNLATGADARLRWEVRRLVAHSAGIAYSDRPGSGLRTDLADSIDGFSEEDLEALRQFSGCHA